MLPRVQSIIKLCFKKYFGAYHERKIHCLLHGELAKYCIISGCFPHWLSVIMMMPISSGICLIPIWKIHRRRHRGGIKLPMYYNPFTFKGPSNRRTALRRRLFKLCSLRISFFVRFDLKFTRLCSQGYNQLSSFASRSTLVRTMREKYIVCYMGS